MFRSDTLAVIVMVTLLQGHKDNEHFNLGSCHLAGLFLKSTDGAFSNVRNILSILLFRQSLLDNYFKWE